MGTAGGLPDGSTELRGEAIGIRQEDRPWQKDGRAEEAGQAFTSLMEWPFVIFPRRPHRPALLLIACWRQRHNAA